MTSRGTIIVALLALQASIVALGVVSVYSGLHAEPFAHHMVAPAYSGSHLVEGGAHQVFDVGAHPALTVDIGYADLTIVTGKPSQIDVSLSETTMPLFDSNGPISAHAVGDTVHISRPNGHTWSSGDDRMVTVVVPPETAVTVVSGGDVKTTGLRAEASLNSVGSGSITVVDYDAPRLHATSRGSILLQGVTAARLDVASKDDKVEGSALRVQDGSIESDDQVSLGFAPGTNALVDAETSDGAIAVSGFPDVTLANGGKVGDTDAASQTVRVGAGSGHLEVHTRDGNIALSQEGG